MNHAARSILAALLPLLRVVGPNQLLTKSLARASLPPFGSGSGRPAARGASSRSSLPQRRRRTTPAAGHPRLAPPTTSNSHGRPRRASVLSPSASHASSTSRDTRMQRPRRRTPGTSPVAIAAYAVLRSTRIRSATSSTVKTCGSRVPSSLPTIEPVSMPRILLI